MERVLNDLCQTLRSTLDQFQKVHRDELIQALHSPAEDHLPNADLLTKADTINDLLHEVQVLLQPGPLTLADHFLGHVRTKCLVAAVKLGVPDVLHNDIAITSEELAKLCHADPVRLQQVMRVLSGEGVFAYDPTLDSYRHNHVSKLLVSSHWMGWRDWVDIYANKFYDMGACIPDACVAGETRSPAQIHYKTDLDLPEYVRAQGWLPDFYKAFNAAVTAQTPGLLTDYPWHEIGDGKIIDVGGGDGGFISAILRKFPGLRGGVLEKPPVAEMARAKFREKGAFADVGSRVADVDIVGGSFFESVPANDVYVIKWCLHNWLDADATRILKVVRRAIQRTERSRLVLFEQVIENGYSSRLARYGDMNMLVAVNGRERSLDEFKAIASASGWNISRVFRLRNVWSVAIELTPTWEDAPNGVHPTVSIDGEVNTKMTFLEPWDGSKGNPYFRSIPDPGFEKTNFKWEDYDVEIRDARPNKHQFSLDQNGFTYFEDPDGGLADDLIQSLSNNDREVVVEKFYPRIERLVKMQTGANRVIIFDHTVRRRRPELDSRSNENGQEQPATIVHCDQSGKGARRRLKQNLGAGDDVEAILKKRIQLLNIWRPLNGTVIDWPLAQMDCSTLLPQDAHPCDLWRYHFEERGQTMTYTHNSSQKWYYLSGHKMNEVTMLKIWDSSPDVAANMCAHAAFKHPKTPAESEPRESIEVRCILIHD